MTFSVALTKDQARIDALLIRGPSLDAKMRGWPAPAAVDSLPCPDRVCRTYWFDAAAQVRIVKIDHELRFDRYIPFVALLGDSPWLPIERGGFIGATYDAVALRLVLAPAILSDAVRFAEIVSLPTECHLGGLGINLIARTYPPRPHEVDSASFNIAVCAALPASRVESLLIKKWGRPTRDRGDFKWTRSDGVEIRATPPSVRNPHYSFGLARHPPE